MLNPLSADLATIQSLLFSGLEAISYNINRKNSDLKFNLEKHHNYLAGYEEKTFDFISVW
jgi:phenylalanyl-tRNA synthetase beta chain